jgi:hypothetical protein
VKAPGNLLSSDRRGCQFDGVLDQAVTRRVDQVLVVRGPGRFARAVADGPPPLVPPSEGSRAVRSTRPRSTSRILTEPPCWSSVASTTTSRWFANSVPTSTPDAAGRRGSRHTGLRPGTRPGGRGNPRARAVVADRLHAQELDRQRPSSSPAFRTGPAPSLPMLPLRLPPPGTWPMPPTTWAWLRTWCSGKPRRCLVTSPWTLPGGRSAIASPRCAGVTAAWCRSPQ